MGRRSFSWFQFINTLSFSFLAGNLLTLLLLRLGGSNTLIGIVNGFVYLSFFFMPIGRKLVGKIGLVSTFARAWGTRYLVMAPVILVPIFWPDNPLVAIPLIVAGYLGFQVFRGIGIVSFNPIMKALSQGKDQGQFLNRVQILVHLASISANLAVAMLIGRDAPLWRYSVSIALGVLMGIWATWLFTRLAEPTQEEQEAEPAALKVQTTPDQAGALKSPEIQEKTAASLWHSLRDQLKKKDFRRFLTAFSVLICFSSLVRAFLPVYAKQVYLLADDVVLLLNLAGSLGAVIMGLINRLVMDRLGAKPMIVIFTTILLASLIPILTLPAMTSLLGILILGLSFFLSLMGISGSETSSQGYFFAILPRRAELDLGIWYYLIMGLAGSLGSAIGGAALDGLKLILPLESAFKVFFLAASGGIITAIILALRMERLNARSLRSALSMLFSLRDWRAISLIQRLEGSRTIDQEQQVLRDIRRSTSDLPVEEVLERLSSPLFRIRREALTALYYLPYSRRVQQALLNQIRDHQFATAYHAARIIGQRGTKDAIPVLREAITSSDYLLAANSLLALADLDDTASRPTIEGLLLSHDNPTILTYGAAALRAFNSWDSLPVLYQLGEQPNLPDYVAKEAAFSAAGIMGLENTVYRAFREYQSDQEEGLSLAGEILVGSHEVFWTPRLCNASPAELFHEAEVIMLSLVDNPNTALDFPLSGLDTNTADSREMIKEGTQGMAQNRLEQARLLTARPILMANQAFTFLCQSLILSAAASLPEDWYEGA